MSFMATNPITAPEASSQPPTPPFNMRGLFPCWDGWYDISYDGSVEKLSKGAILLWEPDRAYSPGEFVIADYDGRHAIFKCVKNVSKESGVQVTNQKYWLFLKYISATGGNNFIEVNEKDIDFCTDDHQWYLVVGNGNGTYNLLNLNCAEGQIQGYPLMTIQYKFSQEGICVRYSYDTGEEFWSWTEWENAVFKSDLADLESLDNKVNVIDQNSDNEHYPSALAVKKYVDDAKPNYLNLDLDSNYNVIEGQISCSSLQGYFSDMKSKKRLPMIKINTGGGHEHLTHIESVDGGGTVYFYFIEDNKQYKISVNMNNEWTTEMYDYASGGSDIEKTDLFMITASVSYDEVGSFLQLTDISSTFSEMLEAHKSGKILRLAVTDVTGICYLLIPYQVSDYGIEFNMNAHDNVVRVTCNSMNVWDVSHSADYSSADIDAMFEQVDNQIEGIKILNKEHLPYIIDATITDSEGNINCDITYDDIKNAYMKGKQIILTCTVSNSFIQDRFVTSLSRMDSISFYFDSWLKGYHYTVRCLYDDDGNGLPVWKLELVDMVTQEELQDALRDSTPIRGTDYWTDEDIAEIKSYVDESILGGAW